ncbi:MAG: hypothetical protein B7L53_07540 [Thermofilum sp. NZ13]|nr:MAG: hypothetical protein B7L53_07540 [Thermofilum sp. NZ13]
MMISTEEVFKRLEVDFYSFTEPSVEPETVNVTFGEIIECPPSSPRLSYLAGRKLYKHQYVAFQELVRGKNVVLRSGTGSGKTEAWWLYVAKERKKTLAVYPTLALSYDQLSRLEEYSSATGLKVYAVDATTRASASGKTFGQLKSEIRNADIVVTNPAFLLMDVKRLAVKPSSSLLLGFINELDLLVVDEIDFYSPRGLSLLLSLIRILAEVRGGLQVAVLTATLSNPEDMCSVLKEYTGKDCAIIDGKPFRREDRVYIALGKNLLQEWLKLREYKSLVEKLSEGKEVAEALENFDAFKKNYFKVVEALQALGVEVSPWRLDPTDLLRGYVDDEYATLVFTRSINRAEEIYRKLVASLPDEKKSLVASHHHLVSKERRKEIENLMREGRVKVVISPRTLTQGIDIGAVARVVHIGLPDDVREFWQRNGRKGRRETIPYTETVILPGARWDRELLSRGAEVLKAWVESPIEVTLINKDNKYGLLFYTLFKVKSGQRLSRQESEFLEKLGLYSNGSLTRRGESTWYNINFYEFAPPFGIKRVLVDDSGEKYLEDISFSDLVEKFQVGCLDYSSDGIVTAIRKGGETGRSVRRVIVQPLSESVLSRSDALAFALEEYRKIKAKWGERASIVHDYLRGRLLSEAISNVIPPTGGFGLYHKYPYKTVWIIERERGRPVETESGTIIVRDRRVVEIPALTAGKYQDYTYGSLIELDYQEDLRRIRLGLAFLMVFLREAYRLPLFTFSYSLSTLGGRKTLVLWEEECAGLIEKLDWEKIYRELDAYTPSIVAEVLLLARDEEAHIEWIGLGGKWDLARDLAKRVVEYILSSHKIALLLQGKKLYVPKPGRHLKLASLDVLLVPLDDRGDLVYGYIAIFDGEETVVEKFVKEFYRVKSTGEAQKRLEELLNNNFKLIVFDVNRVREELHMLGLTYHAALLSGLIQMGLVDDAKPRIRKFLGMDVTGLEELQRNLSEEARQTFQLNAISLADVERELVNSRNWLGDRIYRDHEKGTRFLDNVARKYVENSVKLVYLLGLLQT